MAKYFPFLIDWAFRTSENVPSPFFEMRRYLCIVIKFACVVIAGVGQLLEDWRRQMSRGVVLLEWVGVTREFEGKAPCFVCCCCWVNCERTNAQMQKKRSLYNFPWAQLGFLKRAWTGPKGLQSLSEHAAKQLVHLSTIEPIHWCSSIFTQWYEDTIKATTTTNTLTNQPTKHQKKWNCPFFSTY